MRRTSDGESVSRMTQAEIDGTRASRDHELRALEFGHRAIVSSDRGVFRRLVSWFARLFKEQP